MSDRPVLLVVEDDDIVRMLTVEVLEELDYQVIDVDSAEAALDALNDDGQAIDLLLTDFNLPGGQNGDALARTARESRPHLPVLFASGYAEGIDLPASDMFLIAKPYSIDQLRDKVQSILGR